MSELSIVPPAKGDPITAEWARRVTEAANGSQSFSDDPETLRTPAGTLTRNAPQEFTDAPTRAPNPFTVRLATDESTGTLHAHIYVPNGEDIGQYAFCGEDVCTFGRPASASGGWYDLGEVPADGVARYVVVGFSDALKFYAELQEGPDASSTESFHPLAPSNCNRFKPAVVVARVRIPTPAESGEDSEEQTPAQGMRKLSSESGEWGLVQYVSGVIRASYDERPFRVRLAWANDAASGAPDINLHVGVCLDSSIGLRVNGRAVDTVAPSGATSFGAWYDLGVRPNNGAVWLSLYATNVEDMTSGANVFAVPVLGTLSTVPTPPDLPAGTDARFAPPVLLADTDGPEQAFVGGGEISIAVPDSYATATPPWESIKYTANGTTELFGFSAPTSVSGADLANTGADAFAVVRYPTSQGARASIRYVPANALAVWDSTSSRLRFAGMSYAPTTITVGANSFTVLAEV